MKETDSANAPADAVKHQLLSRTNGVRPRKPIAARPVGTILVDPHHLFREGLERLLSETPFRLIASAARVDSIVLPRCTSVPQLVLIGAYEDSMVTIAEIQRAGELYPHSKRVLMASLASAEEVRMALHAGLDAFLSKTITTEMLITTLNLVMMGEAVFSSGLLSVIRGVETSIGSKPALAEQDIVDRTNGEQGRYRFSRREVDTLECLVRGDSNKVIARRFDIAEATVKVHIKAILRKIRVSNRTQAAIWAVNNPAACAPASEETPEHHRLPGSGISLQ